ncbi:MAG: hypothetical protein AAFQ92_22060, partial [Bacteroidota bacterium]
WGRFLEQDLRIYRMGVWGRFLEQDLQDRVWGRFLEQDLRIYRMGVWGRFLEQDLRIYRMGAGYSILMLFSLMLFSPLAW